jgi:glycosyltransferase 2 family protein
MKWKLLLGLALSAVFLYLAFRQARLEEVLRALASASYWLMIPAVALTMVAYALRAVRWRYLLLGVKEISFGPLFSSIMIGFMGNNVLPARLGELLRAHSLGRSTGVSRSAALASIVVERIFDMIVLLLLFGTIVVLRGLPREIRTWGEILLVLVLVAVAVLIIFQAWPGRVFALCRLVPHVRLRQRLLKAAQNFHEALGVLRQGRPLIMALFYSLIMWGCIVFIVACCVLALHLPVPSEANVVVLVAMAIGTMIPAAPGYVGTLQYAGTLGLKSYGVDPAAALSFTLLYHASQWFPVTIVGLVFFLRERVQLSRLASEDLPEEEADGHGR